MTTCEIYFEPCSKLEEQNLDATKNIEGSDDETEFGDAFSSRCVLLSIVFTMQANGLELYAKTHCNK